MSASPHAVPFREKMGYALGDVATNFFFQSMILYQNRFYTDTVGLSPAIVGWMFLIVRLADAFHGRNQLPHLHDRAIDPSAARSLSVLHCCPGDLVRASRRVSHVFRGLAPGSFCSGDGDDHLRLGGRGLYDDFCLARRFSTAINSRLDYVFAEPGRIPRTCEPR